MQYTLLDLLIHGMAFGMAILDFLLRCFRRKTPISEQRRPLCTEEDCTGGDSTTKQQLITPVQTEELDEQPASAAADAVRSDDAVLDQQESPLQQPSTEADSSFGFLKAVPGESVALTPEASTAALPPTPFLKSAHATAYTSTVEHAEGSSPPLEMRTRNIIARSPIVGASPVSATPASLSADAKGSPFSHSTPHSISHQTPSDSGMSTPSVFGLPEFMLEGDYMGMQTPHIVGMNNPITAFRENKQLKRHETPFDTRVEHLMEKERIFKEKVVQHKSSQGSDVSIQQRKTASSDKAMPNMCNIHLLDIENMPSPAATT